MKPFNVIWAVQSCQRKYTASQRPQISGFVRFVLHSQEGRFAIVTNVGSGMRWTRRCARRAHSWQRRFWEHAIRDDADLESHIDYIHFNPVKHAKVTRVADWPHSSFHRFVERGLLPSDWGGDLKEIAGSFGE